MTLLDDEDRELLSSFTRIVNIGPGTWLEVALVRWDGPHSPRLSWLAWRAWSARPRPEELDSAEAELLNDRRYFLVCAWCGRKLNAGHMHDDCICQGCAERELMVVY